MLMVTLGTGVGGGIIIDGKLYTGCNSLAGELGHIVIRQGGEPCGCGRRGLSGGLQLGCGPREVRAPGA